MKRKGSTPVNFCVQRRPFYRFSLAFCAAVLAALFFLLAPAQAQTADAQTQANERAATLAKAIIVRDAFIARMYYSGFPCPTGDPTIVVDHAPSFGNYDQKTGILHISDWTLLSPEERAGFLQLAGRDAEGADDAAAHALFEQGVHRWVLVHELGHWWQACRGFKFDPPDQSYQIEYGANRIALAFWREEDPSFAKKMVALFQGILDHTPSPVPEGQSVEEYFNKNYDTLGSSPSYPWFQARMVVKASQETPPPTFVETLESTKR